MRLRHPAQLFIGILFATPVCFAQNVGIGTTTPASRLHVRGTGGGTQIILEENAGSVLRISNEANASGPYIGTTSNHNMSIVSNNAVRMVVAGNGNVGIGTNNPLTLLDVNGAIRIGNSNTNQPGSIRYNNNRFEGYTGDSWKGFEQVSVSSVITSRTATDEVLLNQGYKYVGAIPEVITRDTATTNMAANTWQVLSSKLNYPPPPFVGESVVWTGTNLIVWGGADVDFENDIPGLSFVNTFAEGYVLDMEANIWDTIKRLPEARYRHTTVWTGTEMIVWGGRRSNADGTFTVFSNGARLNGSSLRWTMIGGPSARYNHTAVWTGTEMIVWGGQSSNVPGAALLGNGSRYNPATNTWTAISTVNAPAARTEHIAVWAGGKMIIWGGFLANNTAATTGAMYDPAKDSWSSISTVNAPPGGFGYGNYVSGNTLTLWGGNIGLLGVQRYTYDILTDTWSRSPSIGSAISSRMYPSILPTPGGLIVVGGYNSSNEILNEAYRGNTAIPPPLFSMAASTHLFWTGQQVIAYGGFLPTPTGVKNGTNRCTRLFLTAQPVTTISDVIRPLFLYQKN